MHITELTLHNIKGFENATLTFPKEHAAGWHVIIGNNGSGKTTLIKALAITLAGWNLYQRLPMRNKWVRKGNEKGTIAIKGITHDWDFTSKDEVPEESQTFKALDLSQTFLSSYQNVLSNSVNLLLEHHKLMPSSAAAEHMSNTRAGLFSASFGAHRNLAGNDNTLEEWEKDNSMARAVPHLTSIFEELSLSKVIPWLKDLDYREKAGKQAATSLEAILNFVNHTNLLPNGIQITKVDPDGVFATNQQGQTINLEEMSDGYRGVTAVVFELLRQMIRFDPHGEGIFDTYTTKESEQANNPFVQAGKPYVFIPGVVLIDEVDLHLHPTWQTQIGEWYKAMFPNVQFIVTTHSPIICRAVGETDTIWHIPDTPDGEAPKPYEVVGTARNQLIAGDILDAYSSEKFGEGIESSPKTREMVNRLTELKRLAIKGKMTEAEKEELQELRSILITQ